MEKRPTHLRYVRRPATRCREFRLAFSTPRDLAEGLSQRELAHRAKLGVNVIHRLETAETHKELMCFRVSTFIQVAEALEVSPCELWPPLGENKLFS